MKSLSILLLSAFFATPVQMDPPPSASTEYDIFVIMAEWKIQEKAIEVQASKIEMLISEKEFSHGMKNQQNDKL